MLHDGAIDLRSKIKNYYGMWFLFGGKGLGGEGGMGWGVYISLRRSLTNTKQ